MKKLKHVLIIILCAMLAFALLAGCKDENTDGTENGGNSAQNGNGAFAITVTPSDDYEIIPSATSAAEGTDITLTVSSKSADKLVTAVKMNGTTLRKWDGVYAFTMPASDVTLSAEVRTLTEVRSDGMAVFAESNLTSIAKNANHNSDSFSDKNWGLDISFVDAYWMTILKNEIISTAQNVIPDSAITLKTKTQSMSNVIVGAKILIDTEKISAGTTWLVMDFASGNVSSDKGSLAVKITVCEYGELYVETMSETLVFDISGAGASDGQYTVRISDEDHIDGSTAGASPFKDYTLNAVGGRITITFDYVVGHRYWIRVSTGGADDYQTPLMIESVNADGAVYTGDVEYPGTGRLTFTEPETVLTLTVKSNV